MENYAVEIRSTFPTREQAVAVGEKAVELHLAACAQISGEILSIYRWKDSICNSSEFRLVLKTMKKKEAELISWLTENHPYEVAEIVSTPFSNTSPEYLAWMQQVTINLPR